MDALFAILSGQTSASGTGKSAGQPAAAGGFDALLASITEANGAIQPVVPVTYRQGQNADATPFDLTAPAPQTAETGSVLASLTAATTTSSPSPTTGLVNTGAPDLPPDTISAGSGSMAVEPSGERADGSAATTVTDTTETVPPLTGQAPTAMPGTGPAADHIDVASSTTEPGAPRPARQMPQPQQGGVPVQPASGLSHRAAAPSGAGIEPDAAVAVTAVNGQLATAAMSAPEIMAAASPDAGVQGRRAGNAGDFEPLTRAAPGAKAATTPQLPAQTANAQPSPATPATPQGPSVQLTPPEQAVEALLGKSSFDKGGQTPIHIETPPPAPESEGETVELSQARHAEASRAAERPGTAAGTARFTPANAGTLAAQIASRFQNGERRFEIRMDPPELGRVEVKMHVSHDNRVHAVLSADRPETLQDMRQHIRELERALADAGLELAGDGLSFELSQDRDENDGNSSSSNGFSELAFAENAAGDVVAAALPRELYGFQLARSSSVDVRL
ncbi:flagellar hook-length control protein FliK [Hyphobacterium sp. HN65]|uniref:Flagellar hook-length control protein FliK n=1 Tax=Hyphobacterium lacteum TaxID=3116575 RepID=A0ABU7LQD9_9PROT|nr:flagellar hook-length control protein FliK [Hyphobacterium sp. HN65]MEE2526116.1 flagellar hook-length control protein FliK [Hyphobacterium sp. HN65]